MEIRRLIWDAGNQQELARHRIASEEVDELISRNEWAVETHPDYPGQARLIGRTGTGRWLTVAMEPTAGSAVWRPITGWDTTPREKAYYWDQ